MRASWAKCPIFFYPHDSKGIFQGR
ncbi:hypothetical protein AvCA_07330 [Azotobacter vinelandii CA]|uniref:Uncharacterized protein n=2 Tax=Azotobacter vinelandii TaxID=354 RepID=C1DLN1_AZOVD|nr:hypothetical protein Avin_07330 [Azotobacter vinelandii DJ]AGK15529.1 hypothetical protein AvCA_07330 [Azotobacter vinelandii CA]AGK19483.1 hypothetical protein AvCA6_07330 [Azotobacter vinelandii CA6]